MMNKDQIEILQYLSNVLNDMQAIEEMSVSKEVEIERLKAKVDKLQKTLFNHKQCILRLREVLTAQIEFIREFSKRETNQYNDWLNYCKSFHKD